MTMCAQEEGRLLMETGESAFMTTQGKKINQANKRKKGHIRQDCVKFQQWFVKKDCIKGKQTNNSKKGAKMNDYTRYMYLYMLHNKSEASVNGGVAATGGFVKDVMKYLVMDDLVVKPVSFVSSITGLNKYFNVKDVSALHEEVVHFGKEEALKLLKLSFESKAVLTSVYMSSVIMNRVKVENI
ncbi:hypothetical protein KY290_028876 [Solanum tuberosum]|uniref:Uncharacterized protein n=1 Tax=Solanum tuberosum TaxID=4113 RepID=A0ABQ7UJG6_SOLTU|nr:hypothetical protein KY290_028876 [Solanum tuberosum]